MNSIITKLSEIETSAVTIVAHAESQKAILEAEMRSERAEFDAELAANTRKKLAAIHADLEEDMKRKLEEQRAESVSTIQAYNKEYELFYETYAQDIIKRITEV